MSIISKKSIVEKIESSGDGFSTTTVIDSGRLNFCLINITASSPTPIDLLITSQEQLNSLSKELSKIISKLNQYEKIESRERTTYVSDSINDHKGEVDNV